MSQKLPLYRSNRFIGFSAVFVILGTIFSYLALNEPAQNVARFVFLVTSLVACGLWVMNYRSAKNQAAVSPSDSAA